MKILENNNNMMILENGDYTYLISYNSIIAKTNNIFVKNGKINKKYGLYLSNKWDYSNTTLKQLYYFIELHNTARDERGNLFGYAMNQEKNKKEYIQKLINNKKIKIIKEEEM